MSSSPELPEPTTRIGTLVWSGLVCLTAVSPPRVHSNPVADGELFSTHLPSCEATFCRLCITASLARWSVFINLAGTGREPPRQHPSLVSWNQEVPESLRSAMTNHSVCLYLIPTAPFSSRDHWRSGVWGRRRSSPYTLGPKVIPY